MPIICHGNDRICRTYSTTSQLPRGGHPSGVKTNAKINDSVGKGGVNREPDVREIQESLNYVPREEGGARPFLVVDGKCGTKTVEAIQKFQLKHFGWSGADGLIEVGRQTIIRLNDILVRTKPRDMMAAHRAINGARPCIRGAIANITFAEPYLNAPSTPTGSISELNREPRLRLMNKHFSVDDSPNKKRTFALVKYHFHLMRTVFERPGGLWGYNTFMADPIGVDCFAYVPGSYFKEGDTELTPEGHTIRKDAIYLCTSFFDGPQLTDEIRIHIVIHELAHFINHSINITDYGYNHRGRNPLDLPYYQQIRNAENYANFARESVNPNPAQYDPKGKPSLQKYG